MDYYEDEIDKIDKSKNKSKSKNNIVDDTENVEIQEEYNNKKKIYFSDLFDDVCHIIAEFSIYDDRLKWVNVSNLFQGKKSSTIIDNDEIINQFIDEVMYEINGYYNKCINDKNKFEMVEFNNFNKCFNLNKDILYSRIARCIEYWHVNYSLTHIG
jgi:hypothetical protein